MKVIYFTKYNRKGASSRLRSYQYFRYLNEQGIIVKASSLFNDSYLDSLYNGKSNLIVGIMGYLRRFFTLFTVFSYDKIVIEKELFPYLPATFERLLSLLKISYCVDYDDAIFHNYDKHPNFFIRNLLRNKIDVVMRHSSCVIAGNSYLAERAEKAGANNIQIIPTVIDLSRYSKNVQENNKNKNQIVIGWVGSPSTFKYVQEIRLILKEVVEKYDVLIYIVGAKGNLGFTKNVTYFPWTEDIEVFLISSFDIGIMPLLDTPWEKGKCSYKLIQYMGCKVSVIASPIGMNKDVVNHDNNGFLASDDAEWRQAFEVYINQIDVRLQHGQAGYETVLANFNLEDTSKELVAILKN